MVVLVGWLVGWVPDDILLLLVFTMNEKKWKKKDIYCGDGELVLLGRSSWSCFASVVVASVVVEIERTMFITTTNGREKILSLSHCSPTSSYW